MTINDGSSLIFANQSSDEYGVGIASGFGSTSRTGNSENRNVITTQNIFNNQFNIHGVKYDSPLPFDLILYNLDETYINADKERTLKKWLFKNNYNWLQIDQPDLSNISYFCIATKIELLDFGTYTGALLVQFQADSPWAWSNLIKKTYTTVNSTLNVNLNMDFDFDEYLLYPTLQITSLADGNISITNSTTNESISITGCITNESIILECSNDKISSSGSNIISRWNKNTISMKEGLNQLVLTGNFKLVMSYRLPIRVGA